MTKLLLIIDMQEGFRTKESEEILPKIIELKKSFDGKIIFSKFINKKNSFLENQLNWTKLQNKKEQKLFKELQNSNNIEVTHYNYTVLTEELKNFIKENKITQIFLSGIYTDVCIIKTAMDLFDYEIESYIIKNACTSLHRKENHNSAISSLKHILGKDKIIASE